MSHANLPPASEVRSLRRTSVSIDEAIAILLGWITGPVELQSNSDDPSQWEEAELAAVFFDLDERLLEIREGFEADLSRAEIEGPPSDVERLHQELTKFAKTEEKTYAFRCAIEDELNKGSESDLRKDQALSNNYFAYITLASFDQWAEKRYDRRFLATPDQSSKHASLSLTSTEAPKPRTLLRDQEKAIIACISSLVFDPKQLPKKSPGKGGVKKQVRDNLDGNSLFKGVTVFDRAWERLRKSGEIADRNVSSL